VVDPSASPVERPLEHPELDAGTSSAPGGGGAATAAPTAPGLALWIPATSDAPTIARHAATRNGRLRGRTRETVELLVTELVTNAIRHAGLDAHDLVSVRIEERPGMLRCEVGDTGGAAATIAAAGPPGHGEAASGGMGLYLVDRLADRWGADQGSDGTCVWFELAL
jgi:anti-sigma regulatory factor (Ser/Thr protein kinase)